MLKSESSNVEPLLRELPPAKRILLAQVINMPGFKVLLELMDAGSYEANESVIRTSPEQDGYLQLLAARQQSAHGICKFSKRVVESCYWHAQQINQLEKETHAEKVDIVKKMYGITITKPEEKS